MCEEEGEEIEGGDTGEELVVVEGVAMEGEGSWISLEEDDDKDEKGVRRKERRGKEWTPTRNGWRWRELPWRGKAHG